MAKAVRRSETEPAAKISIRDLVSYRLSRTASMMSRGAALRYKREFDVNLGEWRALALLADGPPPSLMQLTRAAGLDKAQMSRVVTSLIERGLVVRETAARGGRTVELSLTRNGRGLYSGLIAAAAQRDQAFRAALEPGELAVLETALTKSADQALYFIKEEIAAAGGE